MARRKATATAVTTETTETTDNDAEALQRDEGYTFYKFKGNGGTRGKVDGVQYSWGDGHIVHAPAGNFPHLGGGDCEEVTAKDYEAYLSEKAKTETRKVKQTNR